MLWLLIFLLVLISVISLYCFIICFYSSNRKPLDPYGDMHGTQYKAVIDKIYSSTRRMEEVPYEAVSIQSFDGLKLSGRYYHFHDGAPVKIIFHGYRSMALRDCAGGFALARKLGMNVLAVDQRAHGGSEGHVITFGILERRDCLSWITYVCERFGAQTPIVLSGLSMGAATVLMATSLPLPENVVCVLADSTYTSPAEIIKKVCGDKHISSSVAYPLIRLAAAIYGRFDLEQASATEAITHSPVPVLLIHGEDDRFVPCYMSQQIHSASNGCTRLVTIPQAGHGLCYMVDPVRYENECINFLREIPALHIPDSAL